MTVTVDVTGGPANVGCEVSWGDGEYSNVFTDDAGAATAEHTYPEAGSYPVVVRDSFGRPIFNQVITVTEAAPEPEPEPEAEPEAPEPTPEPQDAPSEPVEPTEGT